MALPVAQAAGDRAHKASALSAVRKDIGYTGVTTPLEFERRFAETAIT